MLIEITSARGKIASERKLAMDATRQEINQHDRRLSIIWLTAMLEAEGTFSFAYNEQVKNGTLHSHIQPIIVFINSDVQLVNRVEFLLTEFASKPYRSKPRTCGIGKKLKTWLQYSGFKLLPLLKLIRPHIVGEKIECIDCMIEFIEFRQHLQSTGKPKQKYSEVEFTLLRRVREINSGHWKQTPKFSQISTEAVSGRRDAVAQKLRLVV